MTTTKIDPVDEESALRVRRASRDSQRSFLRRPKSIGIVLLVPNGVMGLVGDRSGLDVRRAWTKWRER